MNFDNSQIDTLLEKYWEGETTLSEEASLRSYFASNNVDESHKTYKPLFGYFSEQRLMSTDLDVEAVLTKIQKPKRKSRILNVLFNGKYRMGIAAAMTVMLSAVTIMNLQTTASSSIVLDQAEDTEEALRITKEALAFLSKKIDHGSQTINTSITRVKPANIIK